MTSNLETLLRDSLHAEAEQVTGQPDPYETFVRLERKHKRNRYLAVSAGGVAVVAVAAGVLTNPGLMSQAANAHGPSRLAQGSVRGSLGTDQAWLDAFRATLRVSSNDGDEDWKLDRDKVEVVWAGEVPGARIVVADVPFRNDGVTDWHLQSFEGAPGSAPEKMYENGDIGMDGTGLVGTIAMGSDTKPGYALAIGPAGSTVTLQTGLQYGADGHVHATGDKTGKPGDGIAYVPIAPAPGGSLSSLTLADVVDRGRTLFHGIVSAGWASDENSAVSRANPEYFDRGRGVTEATARAALAGHSFDPVVFQQLAGWSLQEANLVASQVTLTVPWTGKVEGQPAIMWHLQVHGGGVLTFFTHAADGHRMDKFLLQPVAGADERPMAWRLRGDSSERRTDRVAVVAPGATTASISVNGGAPIAVALDSTGFAMATVPSDAKATITAQRAGGAKITAPILPFETAITMPGTSPGNTLAG
ncbi:hypothetical protein [Actinoplanes sp. TFC3]|uniref:hypothetical protein n=1 Tax=Actinoplanes sp. TFC3 TaxID=1710355 RepID=UPI0008329E75|nr:hypothetical protein [Actinoplanes sp. TFC3]